MNSFVVHSVKFKSKHACVKYTRNLLQKYLISDKATVEAFDFEYLSELLTRHPEYSRKAGPGIKKIFISKGFSGGPHVIILRHDNISESISWKDACRGSVKSAKHKTIDDYRRAIVPDILNFKSNAVSVCVRCNVSGTLQVDHCGDFEFKDIVTMFETASELERSKGFREFHKKYAKYQLLCIPCHLRKN